MGYNESDTRAKLIDPAIHARGWTEDLIRREETSGAVEIIDGKPRKRSKGRVDYTLRIKVNPDAQPIAIALIEAKAADLTPEHGLEQVKLYSDCHRLNVPFVFSTNGHLFIEFDHFNGRTKLAQPMEKFPTPAELRTRYEQGMGFKLDDPVAKPLLMKYQGGEATRRYYQDAAIRATLEKIAQCEKKGKPKRALLALATGSGKTFIAVNLLKKIADAGQLKRALFLCDRDELRNQGLGAFQNIFGADAAEVYQKSDGTNNAKNARIHIATYQTLDVDTADGTANFLTTHYPENYFSHIIIDECHRSAWGKWSQVLKRNPNAVQIGLTATPRQLEFTEKTKESMADAQLTADNIKHFGEPVYVYDMGQAIEDGYLAACEIQKGRVDIDDTGLSIDEVLAKNPKNAATGQPVTREELQEIYYKKDYENVIMLPDRVMAMCQDFFNYLIETGDPLQKTIIFCVRDYHADQVAITMNNLYASWCEKNGLKPVSPYAFKCTAASGGSQYLADLRGASRSHFIATTVDLLSTGVDVPVVRNIVFFKYVRSPIAFHQMVGRGTRLHAPSGKLMFHVYDYTNATRLFGKEFITKAQKPQGRGGPTPPAPPIITVEGFDVHVTDAGRFIVTKVNGETKPVTVEEYKEHLAERLVKEVKTLEQFRSKWVNPSERATLLAQLPDGGRCVDLIRELDEMKDYDAYDILAELAYGMVPRTRSERAESFNYKHRKWLDSLTPEAAATIIALASQFSRGGTEGLENPQIFMTPEVLRAGGLEALKTIGKPADILRETKERMFAA